ncbi:hypothetical protein ACHAXT_008304 [Thalassiosira profunda]
MKVVSALLLLAGASFAGAAAPASGDCKVLCEQARQGVLGDIGTCKASLKLHPVPKLFNACIEGRKRGFDQACLPICEEAELSVSSLEGCKMVQRTGAKPYDWCRRGYDSILQALEPALAEHGEKQAGLEDAKMSLEETSEEAVEAPIETEALAAKPRGRFTQKGSWREAQSEEVVLNSEPAKEAILEEIASETEPIQQKPRGRHQVEARNQELAEEPEPRQSELEGDHGDAVEESEPAQVEPASAPDQAGPEEDSEEHDSASAEDTAEGEGAAEPTELEL